MTIRCAIVVMCALSLSAGCKHHHQRHQKPLPTTIPAPVTESREQTLQTPPAPHMPVKQGQPPLAYIVEGGGNVQIVDAESSGIVATGVAGPRAIVSVDQNAGVRIGNQLIVKGPLPPGRSYQIFVDN